MRSAIAIAGIADRLSDCDSRKYRSDVGRAVQVRVDGDHAVDASGDQRADGLLADRFAFVERCVLAHVAEIRRQQDQAFRTPRRSASAAKVSAISFSFGRSSDA